MVPIVSASDDNYVHHFAAMLHSASLYHPNAKYILLSDSISQENFAKLKNLSTSRRIDLTVISCGQMLRECLQEGAAAYARLLIPELLDQRIERCLYVDADTTIVAPLDDLFNIDLNGFPIAAVRDFGDITIKRKESDLHGIDFGDDYFNTGVMLMNLTRWREEDIASQAFAYARAHPERMLLCDQSSLNVILYRRNLPLDAKWNFFSLMDARKLSASPHIVHYTTFPKPTAWPESPFGDLYKFHRDQTPWPFEKLRPARRNLAKEARTAIGHVLGIDKYRCRQEHMETLDFIRTEISDTALARARKLAARGR